MRGEGTSIPKRIDWIDPWPNLPWGMKIYISNFRKQKGSLETRMTDQPDVGLICRVVDKRVTACMDNIKYG